MGRLRVMVLAPDCNPDSFSIPYVTYRHAAALAELHEVTLVVGAPVEAPVRRDNAPFREIEVVSMPRLERTQAWGFRTLLKSNFDSQAATAFEYPFSVAFEWYAWRQLRRRILAGEFDVVLRVLPMTPVLPSPFAFFLRKGPIPFVLGPLNGGLPWPPGFSQLANQKEWVAGLRRLYRYMPFVRSTYRHATAIIVASSQTYAEFTQYSDKLFFVPEPGISRSQCLDDTRTPARPDAKLKLIFVGGLVPRKACDLALKAAAPSLRTGLAHFTVVGDGPERNRLQNLVKSLGVESAVDFSGWLGHAEVLARLRSADMLVFPSLRDNGAGIVFEALSAGAVPVVVDFGGPGDIVHSGVGYKVPMTNEAEIVSRLQQILSGSAANRNHLNRLRQQAMSYARECLTWDAKAQSVTTVLNWTVHRGSKPDLLPPKILST